MPKGILHKIHTFLSQKRKAFGELKTTFFDEVSSLRITRNKYLYLPKTQRKLNASPKERIREVREIILLLSEIE